MNKRITKQILAYTPIIIIASLFTCCRGAVPKPEQIPEQIQKTQTVDKHGFIMTLPQIEYTLPVESTSLTIQNNTTNGIYLNEYYSIDVLKGEQWEEIPLDIAFIDIAYLLEAGDFQEFEISLFPDQIKYTPGKYRIRKSIIAKDSNYELTSEFLIKDK